MESQIKSHSTSSDTPRELVCRRI